MNKIIILIICILLLIIVLLHIIEKRTNIKYNKINISDNQLIKLLYSKNTKNINLYYINLDSSINRKQRFLQRLPKYIIPIRINAITPNTLPNIKTNIRFDHSKDKKILSCTASHLKAIYTAYHNNEDIVFISEDDIIFIKNINWYQLINLAPNNWDIIQLHICCLPTITESYNPIYKYDKTNTLFLEIKNRIIPSAACYLINRKAMKKILEMYIPNYNDNNWNNIKVLDFTKHPESYAADDLIFYNTNRYVCTQILIDVDGIDSTLHPENLPKHNITKKYIQNNL
jgi:GR25 family glycosyltransferase involved in LPS biosynthesis